MANIIIPTEQESRTLGKTHKVPDEWLLSRLVPWFFAETMSTRIWVCYQSETGKWGRWMLNPDLGPPTRDRQYYAERAVAYLNANYNFDGAWVAAWLGDEWRTFYLLWKDRDGDIQIPIECELGWRVIKEWEVEDWGNQAVVARESWLNTQRVLALSEMETIKRAQGQLRPE